jgi:hypothetical protein
MKRYWKRESEGKEIKWITVEVDMPSPWHEVSQEEYEDIKVNKKWWRR